MRKLLFSIPVLAATLVVFASVAAAGPPTTATGTFAAIGPPTFTDVRIADGNTFFTQSIRAVYAGDLTGPFVVEGAALATNNGSVMFHATVVCTGCTISGRTGDFTAVTNVSGPSLTDVTGTFTVMSASGGLAGLHGNAQFVGTAISGTYSFHYNFEP